MIWDRLFEAIADALVPKDWVEVWLKKAQREQLEFMFKDLGETVKRMGISMQDIIDNWRWPPTEVWEPDEHDAGIW